MDFSALWPLAQGALAALVPILSTWLVQLIRGWSPTLPKWAAFLLAPALGTLGVYFTGAVDALGLPVWTAPLFGMLSTFAYEGQKRVGVLS